MKFRQFLAKTGDMLDVSIQSADKFLTSSKRILDLLNSEVNVTQKTDGVKLTVLKIANDGKLSDYIFSYKGNILYPGEYEYASKIHVKESLGSSQFKLVFEHFAKNLINSIPVGTELLIEFLMNKPTLMSNYKSKHKMVLIGYSESTYNESSIKFGKLETTNSGFMVNDSYAKALNIDVPRVLFNGYMNSYLSFERGIVSTELRSKFRNFSKSMNWNNPDLLIGDIKELLLNIESKYGGTEEGCVLQTDDLTLKFQQEYQTCPVARANLKAEFNGSENENILYWSQVKALSQDLYNKTINNKSLIKSLQALSNELSTINVVFSHPKKSSYQIKDDIQLSAKNLIVKNLRGNNGSLIIGKFRVLTIAHVEIIKTAIKKSDRVTVCIVSNISTKDTREFREEAIRKVFPDVEIIHHSSGNLISIIKKSPFNINTVYAGTDRIADYRRMLNNSMGVNVREIPRTNDVSATKILDNIEDEKFFLKHTPKIESYYSDIKKIYLGV